MEDQIKINFGGNIVDNGGQKLKKYDHSGEDLEPLTKQSKKQKQKEETQPDVLENNLFRQEEEKKEGARQDEI